jgi:sec-independent protein translocase protein TatA
MRFGFAEIVVILIVLLLIFGPGKIPQLGDAIGKGIRNFKKAAKDADDSIDVTPRANQPQQQIAGTPPQAPAPQPGAPVAGAEVKK